MNSLYSSHISDSKFHALSAAAGNCKDLMLLFGANVKVQVPIQNNFGVSSSSSSSKWVLFHYFLSLATFITKLEISKLL